MPNKFSISADLIIGFLGSGQLARMSAAAAMRMGIRVASYSGSSKTERDADYTTPTEKLHLEPLDWMTPLSYPGAFSDEAALVHFARACDLVTLENEFLDGQILSHVASLSGTPILPSPSSFLKLESKWLEKETFRNAGIPVTPYQKISNIDDLERVAKRFSFPFVLKSSKGGYDGYGNKTVRSPDELEMAFTSLGGQAGRELIAESFIPFKMELAVQIARNRTGYVVYPCCETIQKGHICKTVIAPARIDRSISEEACAMAVSAMEAIDGTGLFAFEFFLTEDNTLYLNESAPRPHNSGHYTIEGCHTSQFENHIRAILGLPLGSTEMRRPVAVMENLLGIYDRSAITETEDEVWLSPDTHLHVYGKQRSRTGRKMGHLTVLGDDYETTAALAASLSAKISI